MREFPIDLGAPSIPFPHYGEECVGSVHAALALREDRRSSIEKCRVELGFKRVRFHGLLNDDMSVFTGDGDHPYSFFFFQRGRRLRFPARRREAPLGRA
ncbi:MAG: hypothetical protein GX493_02670 [Firmicutes bacterium]|nr:hypothetical protein [Bacillota bacterium]